MVLPYFVVFVEPSDTDSGSSYEGRWPKMFSFTAVSVGHVAFLSFWCVVQPSRRCSTVVGAMPQGHAPLLYLQMSGLITSGLCGLMPLRMCFASLRI